MDELRREMMAPQPVVVAAPTQLPPPAQKSQSTSVKMKPPPLPLTRLKNENPLGDISPVHSQTEEMMVQFEKK
jgi:hypothetical protein